MLFLLFSLSVKSNSLPALTIYWIFLNFMSIKSWCYPTISSSAALFSFCLQSFRAIGSFSNDLAFCIRWPKYWSFSISSSNEYLGLISFRIDWFDLLVVQRTFKESSPAPQFKSSNSWCSAFFIAQFSHLYVYHLHIWGCWYFSWQS